MKKLNYLLLGAAGLLMASCSQDDILNNVPDDGLYHLTVRLPGEAATRAELGDGLTADNLYMAVYDADNGNALIYDDLTLSFDGQISTEVALSLVKGKSYNIAFFALSPTAANDKVYNFNSEDGVFTVDYTKMQNAPNNADAYDCFFRLYDIDNFSGATQSAEVLLNRPVAQINWGTNDLTEEYPAIIDHFGVGGEYIATGFNTTAYNTWNFFGGTDGSGDVDTTVDNPTSTVVLTPYTPPTDELFPVGGYEYVALQYVLAPQTETLYNLTLTISDANQTPAPDEVISNVVNVDNAPVQANYRTNIYGSLLSEDVVLTVTKDKEWETPDYEVVYINGIAYLVINGNNNSKLWRANGYFILGTDVTYPTNQELQFVNNTNVIDLNGHSLTSHGNAYGDAVIIQGSNVTLSNGSVLPSETASLEAASATIIVQGSTSPSHLTLDNMTVTGYYPVRMTSSNTESTITINSGTYYPTQADAPAVLVGATKTSTSAGKVTIYGGTFGQPGVTNGYLLNVIDNLVKISGEPRDFIEVFGGTFINFNPADNGAEGVPTNFVADGYKVVESTVGNDTYYTVVPESAITVDGTTTTMAQALAQAKNGDTIFVGAGNIATPTDFNKSVTIKGLGAETSILQANDPYWTSSNGANLTFEDVQFKSFVNNSNHTSMGFIGAGKQTYTNVIFDGEFHVFTGSATFTNCGFNYYGITGNNYQLWCQTDGPIVVENCSMLCNGSKAILVYGDKAGETGGNITINGLKVTNSGTVGTKALVEIHSENYIGAGTINLSNITYDASDFPAGLWQEVYNVKPYEGEKTDYYKVIVNGTVEQVGGFTGEFTGNN